MSTQPFFIVSSGRSGTAMLHKALSADADVEMHHEYMVHHIQPLAVRRYLALCGAEETRALLAETYGAAVQYSEKKFWGDSSNKASWLIPDLFALFPKAKFVHLVRDGRKVAGSYFNKLAGECYDDRSTQILRAHVEKRAPAPPPEKKYWWPLPNNDDPSRAAFNGYDQFGRIAWHWAEINRVILNDLCALPQRQTHFVKLEELRDGEQNLKALFDFLGLPYQSAYFAMFQRPHNVNRPEDKLLSQSQRVMFDSIAGAMMKRLGYAEEAEYVVKY